MEYICHNCMQIQYVTLNNNNNNTVQCVCVCVCLNYSLFNKSYNWLMLYCYTTPCRKLPKYNINCYIILYSICVV